MTDVSIVVVTHNSAKTIQRCLQSLPRAAGATRFDLTVVDTGSTDRTCDAVRASPLPVTLRLLGNRGFAAAANAGAAQARGLFLFFLNPDAELPPKALEQLVALCQHPHVAAVSGLITDAQGKAEPFGEPFPSLLWYLRRRVTSPLIRRAPPAIPFSVPWLSGAALLVRAEAFHAIGGFSEDYFLYYEDIDLSRRLRARGGTLLLDPAVRIHHLGGQSAGTRRRLRASDRSEDTYFAQYRPRWEARAVRLFRLGLRHLRATLLFVAVLTGLVVISSPAQLLPVILLGAAGTVLVSSARVPEVGAFILLVSLLPGQLLRLPLAPNSSLTLTDLVLPLVLGGWGLVLARQAAGNRQQVTGAQKKTILLSTAYCLLPAVAAILPGLLLAAERLPPRDLLHAAGYALRLLLVVALVPLGAAVLRRPLWVHGGLLGVGTALALLGFVQLVMLPSLSTLSTLGTLGSQWSAVDLSGWDPHVGRLFSTWLDPNLQGGLFVLAAAVLLSLPAPRSSLPKLTLIACGIVILLALVLTKSRTTMVALLAVIVAYVMVGMRRAGPHAPRSRGGVGWRRLTTLATAGVLSLALVPTFASRFRSLNLADPTARLRIESWAQALQHAADAPLFGIGYNAYGFEQLAAGNIRDLAIHSRAGAENSLLTFLATTGVWGVAMLGVLLLVLFWSLLRGTSSTASGLPPGAWMSRAAFLGLIGLLVHAQFVHSLAYIHLAVPLSLLVAAAFSSSRRLQGRSGPAGEVPTPGRALTDQAAMVPSPEGEASAGGSRSERASVGRANGRSTGWAEPRAGPLRSRQDPPPSEITGSYLGI